MKKAPQTPQLQDEIQEKWITDKLIRRGLLKEQCSDKKHQRLPSPVKPPKKVKVEKKEMSLVECLATWGTEKQTEIIPETRKGEIPTSQLQVLLWPYVEMWNGNIHLRELDKIMDEDRLVKEREKEMIEIQKQNFNGFDKACLKMNMENQDLEIRNLKDSPE